MQTKIKSLLLIAAAAAAFACATNTNTSTPTSSGSPSPSAVPAATADVMAAGRKLYSEKCAACHKENGKGGKMTIEGKTIDPDDLTSEKMKKFSDEKLYGYIYNGIEDDGMPAFKDDLSEAQIREVVRYLRSDLQKLPIAP